MITIENFDVKIKEREIIDALAQTKHPIKDMDESGFTFYDYALWKRTKHKRPCKHVVEKINDVLLKGDDALKFYY